MENQSVRIRMANVDDYPSCLPLLRSLYHGDVGPNLKRIFEEFVNGRDSTVLLAERSARIVGILIGSYHLDIDWEGEIAKTEALVVEEPCRRKGIARKLVRHFAAMARRRRCRGVKSRVNTKNVGAQEFHEKLGFERADTYEYVLSFHE